MSLGRFVADPGFWERAILMRPTGARWPPQTPLGLFPTSRHRSRADGSSEFDEGFIWKYIGEGRMRPKSISSRWWRSRAESLASTLIFRNECRLGQARALVALGQTASATTLLAGLLDQQYAETSKPAMALLGAIRFQQGDTRQALTLLRHAVEDEGPEDWSYFAQAEADLGLTYLVMGDNVHGLDWLHKGQKRFAAEGRHELLAWSLVNEGRYFQERGDLELSQKMLNRSREMANRYGLLLPL